MKPSRPTSNLSPLAKESQDRNDKLKRQRLAHEDAQKAAGLWGDHSVGVIRHHDSAFVHIWKGTSMTNLFKLAMKRPKEITKSEHDLLCVWLKAGRYEGFNWKTSAWNVNLKEAERIKHEVIGQLTTNGTRIINSTIES